MFCPNCGNQVNEGAAFCAACGTKVEAQAAPQPTPAPAYEAVKEPVYTAPQQPAYTAPQQPVYNVPQQPANNPALDSEATNCMIFSIIGLATGVMFGVPGIILSCIAKNKLGDYTARGGRLDGKAKVASILSKIGLPVSIAMTGVYCLSFLIGFISAL